MSEENILSAADRWAKQEAEAEMRRRPEDTNVSMIRFVWQPVEDMPHAEVIGGKIERCKVMPIFKRLVWDNIDSLSPELIEPGYRRRRQGDQKDTEAAYAIQPGYICQSVLEEFGPRGVIELEALRGVERPEEFTSLRIDSLFFPDEFMARQDKDGKDRGPLTYEEIRQRVIEVKAKLVAGEFGYSDEQRRKLALVADDFTKAVRVAEDSDNALLDESEREMELGKSDRRYKQVYDARDIRALRRLNRQHKDKAIHDMAKQHTSITDVVAKVLEKQTEVASSNKDLVKEIAQSFAGEFAKIFAAQMAEAKAPQAQQPKARQ